MILLNTELPSLCLNSITAMPVNIKETIEACIHLKLKLKHTYYHATMTKIINKSVIMLYDITLLMFIGIIINIFVLYYYTTAFKKCN